MLSHGLMKNYARQDLSFSKGEGSWLYDSHGKKYLDALGGIAVCCLGHNHPRVSAAIARQAATLMHTSNIFRVAAQERLAERLCRLSGMDAAFFCNSGTEANEAAIKIARLYGHRKGIEQPRMIVAEGSFHGRTMGALSATGNSKIQAGFEPLLEGFVRVPFNDLDAIAAHAGDDRIVAVHVEPIQGEGGVRVPDTGYLKQLRALCDRHGWLLSLDEVQTGVGRTGTMFAFQHEGIVPDVLCLAKALGNGFPIGATLAAGGIAEVLTPGTHGTTYGGNPLASETALAVLDAIEEENLLDNAQQRGQQMLDGFRQRIGELPGVSDIRGMGCMIGIELSEPCAELVARALADGLIINVTAGNVIRLLPPLNLSASEADLIVDKVSNLAADFLAAIPTASNQ